jgi:hypothetical protein
VVHACNLSTQEAEAGELRVSGQPGIHGKILPQKQTNKSDLSVRQPRSCEVREGIGKLCEKGA